MAKNTWFEETFLPSLEQRMNNPKYPNRIILSEKQADVCYRYMHDYPCCGQYGEDFYNYEYHIGTKRYLLHKAGRYTFLNLYDSSKEIWYVQDKKTQEDIATFKTREEMERWLDSKIDDETGMVIGEENTSWTDWTNGMRYAK